MNIYIRSTGHKIDKSSHLQIAVYSKKGGSLLSLTKVEYDKLWLEKVDESLPQVVLPDSILEDADVWEFAILSKNGKQYVDVSVISINDEYPAIAIKGLGRYSYCSPNMKNGARYVNRRRYYQLRDADKLGLKNLLIEVIGE